MTGFSSATGSSVAAFATEKVLSYFQRGATHVDVRRAFGFVLMPKAAVTAEEEETQTTFCEIMLASLEFVAPDRATLREALVTYWPVAAGHETSEIEAAFAARDCNSLIAWYDYNFARTIAAKAEIAGLSGPLLITWPSAGGDDADRDPLIVDFARADYAHAKKALSYWFGELQTQPDSWNSRIREGTFRAGLADAINDTAGVVIAVLSGKWESFTAVGQTP